MSKQTKTEKFLILICGLPGTGKTATAKILIQNLLGYVLVDQNEVRRKHGIKRMPKTQDAVLREIDRMTAGFLLQDRGVIVESGNRYSWRRHQLYGIASGCGKRVVTLETVCGEALAKKRIRSRPPSDGLIADPNDPKVYDRIKPLWENVLIDFKDPGEDHVSYVKFNTEKQVVEKVIVQPGSKRFINKLEGILHEAPAGLRPGYLLPSLRLPAGPLRGEASKAGRERNPSEAKNSSLSSSSLRSRYFAKGDKHASSTRKH